MSVSFWVGEKGFAVGDASFLKALFSTIFVRAENRASAVKLLQAVGNASLHPKDEVGWVLVAAVAEKVVRLDCL